MRTSVNRAVMASCAPPTQSPPSRRRRGRPDGEYPRGRAVARFRAAMLGWLPVTITSGLSCGIGSSGGRGLSLAPYVTGMGPTDGATAAGGRVSQLPPGRPLGTPKGPRQVRAGHLPHTCTVPFGTIRRHRLRADGDGAVTVRLTTCERGWSCRFRVQSRTENPGVGGSIPSMPTILFNRLLTSQFPSK
jgi:hypothetical protein